MIQGEYLDTVADLMQGSLRVVDDCCKTNGLYINPDKTELLHFTRKRKAEGIVRLEYPGVKLNLSNVVRYLGIYLEDK